MAEIELQVLSRQCLDRRIESRAALAHEVPAWTERRKPCIKGIDWQLRTDEARTRLERLHPKFKS